MSSSERAAAEASLSGDEVTRSANALVRVLLSEAAKLRSWLLVLAACSHVSHVAPDSPQGGGTTLVARLPLADTVDGAPDPPGE